MNWYQGLVLGMLAMILGILWNIQFYVREIAKRRP